MSFGMFPVVGKLGKRRSCLLRERTANERASRGFSRSDSFPAIMFRRLPKLSLLVFEQMNGSTTTALPRRSFGETMRADVWWIQPLLVFIGLSTFVVYSTWAAFQGKNYFFGNYVSPFYSPELLGDSPHSWFGPKPAWWPAWLIFSPALLILWAPGGFRLTCYYYRGAYYKAFWADPPACTVGEPRKSYWGERSFPLI